MCFYNLNPYFLQWKPVFSLQFFLPQSLSCQHCRFGWDLSLLVKWTVHCFSGLSDSVITNIVSAAMEKCQVPYLCLNLLSVLLKRRYLHLVVKLNYFWLQEFNSFSTWLQFPLFCLHFSNPFLNLSASFSPLKMEQNWRWNLNIIYSRGIQINENSC